MIELDVKRRADLADRIIQHLHKFLPDSTVKLRGSLASGKADIYSDIDLLWEVPDAAFPVCLEGLPGIMGGIAPVQSFRSDPDFQNSHKRRLLFLSFEGFPLFWRVDLSVLAASLNGDETYDVGNPAARSYEGWFWEESALFNGVAALKDTLRGNDREAQALLERAYTRIDWPFQADLTLKEQILNLSGFVEKTGSQAARLAGMLKELVEKML